VIVLGMEINYMEGSFSQNSLYRINL